MGAATKKKELARETWEIWATSWAGLAPREVFRHAEKSEFVLKLLGLDKFRSYFILLATDSWRKTEKTNQQCLRKWATQ